MKSVRQNCQKQTLGEEELMSPLTTDGVAGQIWLSHESRRAEESRCVQGPNSALLCLHQKGPV